jgi:hypothetical protein
MHRVLAPVRRTMNDISAMVRRGLDDGNGGAD